MERIKTSKAGWLKWFFFLSLFFSGAANAVDLNSASREQLVSVNGIGPKTAENIIRERQRGGPFLSRQDLSLRVKGIGKKRADRLFEAGLEITEVSGGQVAGEAYPVRSTSINVNGKKRSLSAAEPKLIKPHRENVKGNEK